MAQILSFRGSESFRARWLEACSFFNAGKLGEALYVFESLAADGYSEAYVEIGNILEQGGDGVVQDLDAARRWYMKAIDEISDDYAYVGLARLALQGYADAGDLSDAVNYLRMAIAANNPVAMTILGTLYHAGQVVPKDLDQATSLYEQACKQGYVLPLAYLSKVKMEQGHFIVSFKLHLKAILIAYYLKYKDPSDPRLWNYA